MNSVAWAFVQDGDKFEEVDPLGEIDDVVARPGTAEAPAFALGIPVECLVRMLALRSSTYGRAGEPAPAHPHLFRHARVRQIVRTTKSLPIAQKQAGWSRLQMAYLSVSDEEVPKAMRSVDE